MRSVNNVVVQFVAKTMNLLLTCRDFYVDWALSFAFPSDVHISFELDTFLVPLMFLARRKSLLTFSVCKDRMKILLIRFLNHDDLIRP